MRIRPAQLFAIGLLLGTGCGPTLPETNQEGTAAHGGVRFRFLDKTGSVEIGFEPAPANAPGASKQNSRQVFAYFYQAEGSTPMTTMPVDVKVTRGELPSIPLSPGKTGGFASAPGPYDGELRGALEATIDGKKVETPFVIR